MQLLAGKPVEEVKSMADANSDTASDTFGNAGHNLAFLGHDDASRA